LIVETALRSRAVTAPVSRTNDSADESRRTALRNFLRSRRNRLDPKTVGLPERAKRRARGLRREDVAEIAGVSLGWYARFELGQLTSVSERVVDSIAAALNLNETERNYLRALARPHRAEDEGVAERVPENLRFVVEAYTAGPAALLGSRLDLLVVNDIARSLEMGLNERGILSNIAWLSFVDPDSRDKFVDGDRRRQDIAAMLRYSYAQHLGEREYDELIAAISSASDEFVRAWNSFEVKPLEFDELQLRVRGEVVTFSSVVLSTNAAPGYSVVFMRPTDPDHFNNVLAHARLLRVFAGGEG
jgi:transcriptional regulator with XRE-family HTH domain